MTQGQKVDISPNQDGGILKEVIRCGPDLADKPWKGDKVQVSFFSWINNEVNIFMIVSYRSQPNFSIKYILDLHA